jgi:hypothetical protein
MERAPQFVDSNEATELLKDAAVKETEMHGLYLWLWCRSKLLYLNS